MPSQGHSGALLATPAANTGQVPKQTSLRPVTRAESLAVVADALEAAVQQPDVAEVLQGAIERKRRADAERAAREERKRTNAAFRTLLSQIASRRGFEREFAVMGARAIQRHVTDARLLRTFARLTGKAAATRLSLANKPPTPRDEPSDR
jgi:hypothetical protein